MIQYQTWHRQLQQKLISSHWCSCTRWPTRWATLEIYWDLNIRMLNAKLSLYYFTYLLFNVRFIKNNNKIYCRRQGCLSASEAGSAIGFRQQLSTTSYEAFELEVDAWIILCTLERRMTVSYEISWADRCLFGLYSWLSTKSSTATRRIRGLPLPAGCRIIVPVLRILLSRLSVLPSFRRQIHLASFVHHTALIDRDFKIKIASSCEIFTILFSFFTDI